MRRGAADGAASRSADSRRDVNEPRRAARGRFFGSVSALNFVSAALGGIGSGRGCLGEAGILIVEFVGGVFGVVFCLLWD